MDETMMMGLRLVQEGVSNQVFQNRFGLSLDEVYPDQITLLKSQGLVEWGPPDGASLRLARKGILLANRVFVEFIS
jgi:oxygen-independent coproporphyrinogen-3 oxidase